MNWGNSCPEHHADRRLLINRQTHHPNRYSKDWTDVGASHGAAAKSLHKPVCPSRNTSASGIFTELSEVDGMQPVTQLENDYCTPPAECLEPDVAIVGSAIGTYAARQMIRAAQEEAGRIPSVSVLEAGPFDLMGHVGDHPGYDRGGFIGRPERLGGKLMVWGVSTPRPRSRQLNDWLWDCEEIDTRFAQVEAELGVPEPIPMSAKDLELRLIAQLRNALPDANVAVAPLAINSKGRRWTPLQHVPELHRAGVKFVSRFRVDMMELNAGRVTALKGTWHDGRSYLLSPRHVVLAVGAERSIPFLRPFVNGCGRHLRDHFRIDLHGFLPPGALGSGSPDDLGIAVLIAEFNDGQDEQVPFHIEIKVAPVKLWRTGYMQSSDNLLAMHSDDTIYYQLQVVSAMNDPLPLSGDVLNVRDRIPEIMTTRDALLHGRLVAAADRVAKAVGVRSSTFTFRALTTNHHMYAAARIGREVDERFLVRGCANLTVLPPAAYFPHPCDANPTLKSLVGTQYAMESIARETLLGYGPGNAAETSTTAS